MLERGGSPTGIAAAREGAAALRSYAWLVVLLTVLGIIAGFVVGGLSGESKHRVWVTAQALGGNNAVTDLGISTPDGPQAADFLGDGIVTRLEATTGRSYDDLTDHLELEQPPDGGPNPPIGLIAIAGSEAGAQELLGDWLAAIRQARLRYVRGVLARGELGLRKDLRRAIANDEPDTRREIVDLLARMRVLRSTLGVDYAILKAPRSVPDETVSRPRAAVIGGGTGLIAGLALALLISLLGGRLRTPEGVEAALGFELLADLRAPGGVPSAEHGRERLRSAGGGSPPAELLVVPCGDVPSGVAEKLSSALGEGTDVKVTEPLGQPGLVARVESAPAWAVVASPASVRRSEAAALLAELGGVGGEPAGLLVV